MLLLLMLPVVFVVAHVYAYLQRYAPSNVLIARVRAAPPRLRTAAALLLLAAILLVVMHLLADAVETGAPGWLNLVVLVVAWDSIKLGLLAIHTGIRVAIDVVRRLARRALKRELALS